MPGPRPDHGPRLLAHKRQQTKRYDKPPFLSAGRQRIAPTERLALLRTVVANDSVYTSIRLFDQVVIGLLLLAAWYLTSLYVGAYWVPSPVATAVALHHLLTQSALLGHAGQTVGAALCGMLIGGIPGFLLPLALRRRPLTVEVLDPFMVSGYGLPKLALAPLFILWFGIGIASKIALVSSVVFFVVYFYMTAGIRSMDGRFERMARLMGASEGRITRSIVLPSCLPFLLAGLRIATPYSIGGVVISELISSNSGLGYLIQVGAMNFLATEVFAAIVAVTCVGALASGLIAIAERRLLHWRPASSRPAERGAA